VLDPQSVNSLDLVELVSNLERQGIRARVELATRRSGDLGLIEEDSHDEIDLSTNEIYLKLSMLYEFKQTPTKSAAKKLADAFDAGRVLLP
jgi:hypothetical protein